MSFSLSLSENKGNKENSEQTWTHGKCFTLTAPNSACLQLSLLFCPPDSAGATLHIYFPLALHAKYILYLVFTLTTLPPIVTYQKVGRRGIKLPDPITGLLTPVYDCLWNKARGRNQDPNTSVPHHDSSLWAFIFYKPLDPSWMGGTVLEVWAYYFALSTGWELSHLSISSKLCVFFILLWWAEKVKTLASNSPSSLTHVLWLPFVCGKTLAKE